jgi:hypothetical protein
MISAAKKLASLAAAAVGISLVAVAVSAVGERPVTGAVTLPTLNTTVVNTGANPVPTTAVGTTQIAGAVSVSGTPTVSLAQGASVGISPSSNTVVVGNDQSKPVFVRNLDEPGRQPFQVSDNNFLAAGILSSCTDLHGQVPPGKWLVIEYASARSYDSAGALVSGQLDYLIQTTFNGVFLFNGVGANQPLRQYADPGTKLTFCVEHIDRTSLFSAESTLVVTGHLVDAI